MKRLTKLIRDEKKMFALRNTIKRVARSKSGGKYAPRIESRESIQSPFEGREVESLSRPYRPGEDGPVFEDR